MGDARQCDTARTHPVDGGIIVPFPILFIGAAAALGYMLDKGAEAADATANATKWAVAGGALYVAYKGAQTAGVIR